MTRWYRAYEGIVTDAKLAEAAMVSECSRSVSIAAWHCLLESAACKNNSGSFETTPRRVAIILGEPVEQITALFAAFDEIGLTTNGAVAAWSKRQHESDSSTERTRKWRDRKRRETDGGDAGDGGGTSRNGHETSPNKETESESEKEEDSSEVEERSSRDDPGPALLTSEEVFEGYQTLAGELGLTVPRDLTSERRSLTKGRIAQYPLADFLTVFDKCRASPFLRGDRDGRTPLSYDWLMKKGNFQKTLEGNYDR